MNTAPVSFSAEATGAISPTSISTCAAVGNSPLMAQADVGNPEGALSAQSYQSATREAEDEGFAYFAAQGRAAAINLSTEQS